MLFSIIYIAYVVSSLTYDSYIKAIRELEMRRDIEILQRQLEILPDLIREGKA